MFKLKSPKFMAELETKAVRGYFKDCIRLEPFTNHDQSKYKI
jgi:hypothetical protein